MISKSLFSSKQFDFVVSDNFLQDNYDQMIQKQVRIISFFAFIFFSINFSLSLLLLLLCSQTNFHSNLKLGENDDDIWIWFSVTIILNFFLLNFSCNSVHVFAVALHISLRACSLLTPLEGDSITQLVAENISCDLSLTFLISLPRSRIS